MRRRVADESQILVRDVIHLATFVAILNSESIWKAHRSDRVRIHETVRDYEVEGVPTDPIQDCEICMKTSTASSTSSTPEAADEKQVRSDESKGERRERREHRLGGGTRSTVRSVKRLRNRNRKCGPLSNAK